MQALRWKNRKKPEKEKIDVRFLEVTKIPFNGGDRILIFYKGDFLGEFCDDAPSITDALCEILGKRKVEDGDIARRYSSGC